MEGSEVFAQSAFLIGYLEKDMIDVGTHLQEI